MMALFGATPLGFQDTGVHQNATPPCLINGVKLGHLSIAYRLNHKRRGPDIVNIRKNLISCKGVFNTQNINDTLLKPPEKIFSEMHNDPLPIKENVKGIPCIMSKLID